MSIFAQQLSKIESDNGFIAALDQSGGSTPKALKLYGIEETDFNSDTEMFDIVHQMRTRIITSPNFNGERLLGAIQFENTLDRDIDGINSAKFLWHKKKCGAVPKSRSRFRRSRQWCSTNEANQ